MASSDAEKPSKDSFSPKKQKVEEQASDDDDDPNCIICWCRLSERSSTTLGCKHIFHLDCIGSEFNIKGRMQCPTCRQVDAGGNWRFWDNMLPASAMLRRAGNSNAPVQSGSSRDLAGPSLEQGLVNRNRTSQPSQLPPHLSQAWSTRNWLDWLGQNTNLLDVTRRDASDEQQRERVVRNITSLDCIAAAHSLDSSENSRLFSLSNANNTTSRIIESRTYRQRSRDVVPTQEQGQHAANLNAATGPVCNPTVRQEIQGTSTPEGWTQVRPRLSTREMRTRLNAQGLALEERITHGMQAISEVPYIEEIHAALARSRRRLDESRTGHGAPMMNSYVEDQALAARANHGAVSRIATMHDPETISPIATMHDPETASLTMHNPETASPINATMHNPETIGREIQAMSMSQGPAFEGRGRHGNNPEAREGAASADAATPNFRPYPAR